METKNLGLVKAIHVGTVAPTNTQMLWFDTSLATPLHKFYNTTTSSWEALILAVLIDNSTIIKDVDGKLMVNLASIPELQLADGSVTLVKMANVASGTVFYRKTAGAGAPEVQTLAQLKTDLGLTGTNSGDQDLNLYVLKATTVNSKALTGNIVLSAADVGAPAGSGTSTGANTGDETSVSILAKLGLTVLSGNNTGDQDLSNLVEKEAGKELIPSADLLALQSLTTRNFTIKLPAASTVAGRCATPISLPQGWTVSAGSNAIDLLITHSLNKEIASITIWSIGVNGKRLMLGNAAYSGVIAPNSNSLLVESLATVELPITIELIFN